MTKYILIVLVSFLNIVDSKKVFATQDSKTGFLVVAQDRGHLGNKDIKVIVEKFSEEYKARLVFVGRKYDGIGSEYSDYIQKALSEFNSKNISKLVVIPLFLSNSNPILVRVKKNLPAYNKGDYEIKWVPAMSGSYLTSQILLDRIATLSRRPEQEKLVVIGMGAVDEKTEESIKKEYKKIIDYVKARVSFKEVNIGIYYDYGVERKIRKVKNKEVDDMVIRTAAKRGDTLLIPFLIGPKYSHMMSMTHWLGKKFEEFDLEFSHEPILTHANALLWMKRIANQNVSDSGKDLVGVAIMPHGATVPYNEAVETSIQPLKKKYPVELAYGMGDPLAIQDAITALENRGVNKIVFVRMYAMSDQFKDKTDYILGLNEMPPEGWKEKFYADKLPPQIRSSSIIKTFGGYEEDPLIGEIHLERIQESSKNPAEETIILLSHGAKADESDKAWRRAMQAHLDRIQKQSSIPFKKVIALTLREDWPDKRKEALKEIKKEIELGNQNGRTIIISDRLYGSGPYRHFLKDIEYDINYKGLAPHENLTMWLEKGVQRVMRNDFPSTKPKEITAENAKITRLIKKR